MMTPGRVHLDRRSLAVLLIILLGAALSFYMTGLRFSERHETETATELMLMEGTAATPYQYRVLVPWLVGVLSSTFKVGPARLYGTIEFLSIFLFFIAYRYYLSLFIESKVAPWLLSLPVFYALYFNYVLRIDYPGIGMYSPVWYPADMPSLAFFTLGLALIYRRKWGWYYPLFALATFNRETTCFLTVVYLFNALGKERLGRVVSHCAAQFMIWAGIKYLLYVRYSGNPDGRLFFDALPYNLGLLGHPMAYLYLFGSFGYLWIPAIIFFGLVKDEYLRRTMYVCIPYLLGMLLVGVVTELRIYGELIPVLLAPLTVALYGRFISSARPGTSPPS